MRYKNLILIETFIINYLTYQSRTIKTSIKKNEKSSWLKNVHWFPSVALHYKSVGLAESWENFVWLASKRLTCHLSELKLILHLQYYWKLNKEAHYLKKTTGVLLYTNWSNNSQFLLYCISNINHELLTIWICKNTKNLEYSKISADSTDWLCTTNPQNQQKNLFEKKCSN